MKGDRSSQRTRAHPGYDKTRLVFDHFRSGVDKAVERAKRLEELGDDRCRLVNPSSGMWRLVARIVGEADEV